MRAKRFDAWLTGAVVIHFLISVLHGRAHDGGHVAITTAQALFVYVVILATPFAGLALSLWQPRVGGTIVALSMTASLLFGVINHFLIVSPDHVSQVDAAWRPLFATTAALLVVAEAVGAVAGVRTAIGWEVPS